MYMIQLLLLLQLFTMSDDSLSSQKMRQSALEAAVERAIKAEVRTRSLSFRIRLLLYVFFSVCVLEFYLLLMLVSFIKQLTTS